MWLRQHASLLLTLGHFNCLFLPLAYSHVPVKIYYDQIHERNERQEEEEEEGDISASNKNKDTYGRNKRDAIIIIMCAVFLHTDTYVFGFSWAKRQRRSRRFCSKNSHKTHSRHISFRSALKRCVRPISSFYLFFCSFFLVLPSPSLYRSCSSVTKYDAMGRAFV